MSLNRPVKRFKSNPDFRRKNNETDVSIYQRGMPSKMFNDILKGKYLITDFSLIFCDNCIDGFPHKFHTL